MDPHDNHPIQLREGIPAGLNAIAAELYLAALADKLVPVFGRGVRAVQALASIFNYQMCLVAQNEERLVGVLGIQTAQAGFMDVQWGALRSCYGFPGSLWRMAVLSFLHHEPMETEAYVDGVAVAPAWRGRGIGTRLIFALEKWAVDRDLDMLCLEVVDTNARAEKLYRHLGFEVVRQQTVWPLGSLFGFRSSKVMVKLLG